MLYPTPFKASVALLDFIPHTDPSPPIKALQWWLERNVMLLCSPCAGSDGDGSKHTGCQEGTQAGGGWKLAEGRCHPTLCARPQVLLIPAPLHRLHCGGGHPWLPQPAAPGWAAGSHV